VEWWYLLIIPPGVVFLAWYMVLKGYLLFKYPTREYAYLALAVMLPSVWVAYHLLRLCRLPVPELGDLKEAARVR